MRYASVFDGIGAAHVAWQPLGWSCSWTAEIDKFPAAVVEQRWGFDNLGDVLNIKEDDVDARPAIDVFVGGSPCQSFSVAGKRKGLDDARGNLALRYVQLVRYCQPQWIVWENVPGVLSCNGGRDFATFVQALADSGYGVCWRVLDAQHFGVPQRRRRIFLVGYLGDWRPAQAVLLESESLRRNPPKSRQAWKGTTRPTARSLTACGRGGSHGESRGQDDLVVQNAHALTSRHDSSEDGTGRGTPIIVTQDKANTLTKRMHKGINTTVDEGQTPVICFHPTQDPISNTDDKSHAIPGGCKGGQCTAAVAYTKAKRAQSNTDDESWVPGQVAPTMNGFDVGEGRATTVVAMRESGPGYWMGDNKTGLLRAEGDNRPSRPSTVIALQDCSGRDKRQNGKGWSDEGVSYTVDAAATQGVSESMAVRRLTPRECERLQGFPDDYTAIEFRNKPAADSPRYKALGNSMAVPVMRWIGERICMVDAMLNKGGE